MNSKDLGVLVIASIFLGIIIFLAFEVLGLIIFLALILGSWIAYTYNNLVNNDVSTSSAWGRVQSAYQRRADLISRNLVEVVKGSKNFEQNNLTKITELRSQAGKTQVKTAKAKTNDVLSRLLVTMENYPDFKSTQAFNELTSQLERAENKIKFERDEYNNVVETYQVSVRRFPTNIIAGMLGFSLDKWKMFEAEVGSNKVPKVSFE